MLSVFPLLPLTCQWSVVNLDAFFFSSFCSRCKVPIAHSLWAAEIALKRCTIDIEIPLSSLKPWTYMNLSKASTCANLLKLPETCPALFGRIYSFHLIPSNALDGVDAVSEQPGNAKEYASMSVLREKLLQAIRSQSGFDLSWWQPEGLKNPSEWLIHVAFMIKWSWRTRSKRIDSFSRFS